MNWSFIILFCLMPSLAWSKLPVDVVFDIDQTIVTEVHEGPGGDWLADPTRPDKGIISITYDEVQMDEFNQILRDPQGRPLSQAVTERYRVFEGVEETLEKLLQDEKLGRARVSFFSGGTRARNEAILEAIKLKDGSSVRSHLVKSSERRMLGREDMTPTGKGPEHRIRERFKKDLRKVNADLSDVVLVDDIRNFVPDDQLGHVLWLDEDFPFPERRSGVIPTAAQIEQERGKFRKLSRIVNESITERMNSQRGFAQLVHKRTPLRAPCLTFPFEQLQNLFLGLP